MSSRAPIVTPQDRRRLCAVAAVDDRSLLRYLRGERVRSTVEYRIRTAAQSLGIDISSNPGDGSPMEAA